MDFSKTLKDLRLARKLTQGQLAEKSGVTLTAISGWELGRTKPTADSIAALANGLDVSADILLGLPTRNSPPPITPKYSEEEEELISRYRFLDDFGKQAVLLIINHEVERVTADYGVHNGEGKIVNVLDAAGERYIPKYLTPAAAGFSAQIDEAEFEMLLVDKTVPPGADYAVVIHGESMLPVINDGDTVFVKKTSEIHTGDIGIFSFNGASYCKMYYVRGSGDVYLVSLNPEYLKSNVVIKASATDSLVCQGRVMLKKRLSVPNYFMDWLSKQSH